MTDERCPRARDIDRIERRQDAHENDLRANYVRKDVYLEAQNSDRTRITRLENQDSSEKAGNRSWLLGVAQLVIGAALGILAAYLTAKGGK